MKFVLVNGRTLRMPTCCASCFEPIEQGYVRDLATGISYCNHFCWVDRPRAILPYAQKRRSAAPLLQLREE